MKKDKILALTHANVLVGTDAMKVRAGITVLVKNGRIEAVKGGLEIPNGAEEIDLAGRYLMPGLINAHVHLPGNGKPSARGAQNPKTVRLLMGNPLTRAIVRCLCEHYAKQELLSGTTTIRTVGGLGNIDTTIRDRINRGKVQGPRILAADMAVSVPDGHMAGVLAYEAKTPQEARLYVRKIAQGKPDLIKIMVTGGVLDATVKGEPGVLKMTPECIAAACEEAHLHHLPVAAHAESPDGVRAALQGGVDTVEHGATPDEEILTLFKENHAADICTISPAVPLANFPPQLTGSNEVTQYNGEVVMDGIIACAKACREAGIPVGLGTDTACPYVSHTNMWRELLFYSHYVGVSAAEALRTATAGNARILGIDGETGTVEVGKSADFLVTEKNPIADLRALSEPWLVVMRGKVYRQPKPKKDHTIEAALDAAMKDF